MEFRLLRSFLVVAEELNIGRAAKRLFIAQPPLSKQIHQLEMELEVQLFERIPKGLKLTPAGETLVVEAKKIRLALEQATATVSKAGQGSLGRINIGFSGALPSSILPKMLAKTNQFYPNIDFHLHRKTNSNLVLESVANGDIDAGIVLLPISVPGICQKTISHHRLVAAVPISHPLANEAQISLKALQNESFITNHAYKGSVIREVFINACKKLGFNPKIVKEADDTYSIIMLVAAGLGITITLEGLETLNDKEVKYLPLHDNDSYVDMAVVWREGNPSLLLQNAIKTI